MKITDKTGLVEVKIGDMIVISRNMLEEDLLCRVEEEHSLTHPPCLMLTVKFPVPIRPNGQMVTGYKAAVKLDEPSPIVTASA